MESIEASPLAPPEAMYGMSILDLIEFLEADSLSPFYQEKQNHSNSNSNLHPDLQSSPDSLPQPLPWEEQLTLRGESMLTEEMSTAALLALDPDLGFSEYVAGNLANADANSGAWGPMHGGMPPTAPGFGRTGSTTASASAAPAPFVPPLAHDPPSRSCNRKHSLVDTTVISMQSYMARFRGSMEKGVYVLLEFVRRDKRETLDVTVYFGSRQPAKAQRPRSEKACKFELKCLINQDPEYSEVLGWIAATKPAELCQLYIGVFFDVARYGELSRENYLRSLTEVLFMALKDASYARIDARCIYQRERTNSAANKLSSPPSASPEISQTIAVSNAPDLLIAHLFTLLPWQQNAAVLLHKVCVHDFAMLLSIPVHLKYLSLDYRARVCQGVCQGVCQASASIGGECLCSVEHFRVVERPTSEHAPCASLVSLVKATTVVLETTFDIYAAVVRPNIDSCSFADLIIHEVPVTQFKENGRLDSPLIPSVHARPTRLQWLTVKINCHGNYNTSLRLKSIRRWIVNAFPPADRYSIYDTQTELTREFDAQSILADLAELAEQCGHEAPS